MDGPTVYGTAVLALGGVQTAGALAACVAGVLAEYPGRSLSVTGVVVGITPLAIGNAARSGGPEP